MKKLLDADWSSGVQLFHYLYSSTINDFFETNKMADMRNLNTNEIALKKIALENTNKTPHFG